METNFGNKIKSRRKQLGLTQKQLGLKVGLSEGSISRYENNEIKDAPTTKLNLFAKALNVDLDWIIGITPKTTKYAAAAECFENIQELDDDQCLEIINIINNLVNMMKKNQHS